jgi:hypothetical protein
MEELGDGVPGGADFPEVDLVLMLGAVILGTSEDHETAIRLREAATILGRPSNFWAPPRCSPALALAGLTQHALEEFAVLELVLDGVAMIGARLIQELLKVVGVALSLAHMVVRGGHVGVGMMLVLLLPFPLP